MRKEPVGVGGVESVAQTVEGKLWHSRSVPGDQFAAGLFALVVLGVGCTKAWMGESRLAPTGLAPQDAIAVILAQRAGDEYFPGLENKVAGCIRNALQESYSGVRVVLPDEVRQLAFPDQNSEELPQDDSSWERLVRDPLFLERIAPLGLRYLIAVAAGESTGSTQFDWDVASGGDAGALVLDWSRDRMALMEATVVDFMHRRVAGRVRATAAGKSHSGVFLFMLVLPIPYGKPSFPVGTACWELGKGVAEFLVAEGPPME